VGVEGLSCSSLTPKNKHPDTTPEDSTEPKNLKNFIFLYVAPICKSFHE
jgi:hypothetical protein